MAKFTVRDLINLASEAGSALESGDVTPDTEVTIVLDLDPMLTGNPHRVVSNELMHTPSVHLVGLQMKPVIFLTGTKV